MNEIVISLHVISTQVNDEMHWFDLESMMK
jgi:hypothetical protein